MMEIIHSLHYVESMILVLKNGKEKVKEDVINWMTLKSNRNEDFENHVTPSYYIQ